MIISRFNRFFNSLKIKTDDRLRIYTYYTKTISKLIVANKNTTTVSWCFYPSHKFGISSRKSVHYCDLVYLRPPGMPPGFIPPGIPPMPPIPPDCEPIEVIVLSTVKVAITPLPSERV